ncbi:MAG TPA: hypothetical protein VK638_19730, partial [Edaphobacter sp.]|nr:hypothetical protein [Edaphobacter sp.]
MQQAILCIALGVVSAVAWFVEPLVSARSGHALTLWFSLFVVTVLGTFVASIWISYDLRTGIESERWPEEQYATLTIAALFFLFSDLMSHHH